MALPIGTFNLFYQPGNVEYYLTLDPTSQFQPTLSVLIPGAKSQEWQVSGDQLSNLRAVCSVSAGICIGRSAANLNDTLTEPTPVPWYLAASPFGPGWYKFSANSNDAGPWWVVGVEPSSGTPETLMLDSGGWNIFFFRPVQADSSITSTPPSSSSSSSSATTPSPSTVQNSSSISSTSPSISAPLPTSMITTSAPNSPTGIATSNSPTGIAASNSGNSNALSQGDIAGLASSIPLGILGLILVAWGLWYARKQKQAGKPVIPTLMQDVVSIFHRHPSQGARFAQQQGDGFGEDRA